MPRTHIAIAAIAAFGGAALAAWGAMGWAVTGATGVMSAEQRWEFAGAMLLGACFVICSCWLAARWLHKPR